jgi:hypothetical protein
MPSIESSRTMSRKHEESCGLGVPELKSVGVACVNSFWDLHAAMRNICK